MNSKHYEIYRKKRDALIQTIGEGEIIYETISYEERFHRSYRICITDNCILMVKPLDKEDYTITKYIARPSRIKQYWAEAPDWLIEKSVEYARKKYWIQGKFSLKSFQIRRNTSKTQC